MYRAFLCGKLRAHGYVHHQRRHVFFRMLRAQRLHGCGVNASAKFAAPSARASGRIQPSAYSSHPACSKTTSAATAQPATAQSAAAHPAAAATAAP